MGNRAEGASAYKINLNSDNKIGGGQYVDVYKVQKKDTKKFYAAKFLKPKFSIIESFEKQRQFRKSRLWRDPDHPFVIKYKDEFMYQGTEGKQLCIITQLADGGNLNTLMKQKKILSEDEGMYYFTMILMGLHHLKIFFSVAHADLKPENILINKLPGGLDILVIGDYGVSKQDLEKIKISNTLSGLTTPAYMAPEMIVEKAYTAKADMWALGVILYQFLTNQLPFEAPSYYDMMKLIKESEPAPLPSRLSPFIKEIIARLLDKNPETRPDAQELLFKDEIQPYVQKIITQVSQSDEDAGVIIMSQMRIQINKVSIKMLRKASKCYIHKEGNEFLQKQLKIKEAYLTLFYRGSRDGWMIKDFHNYCDDKGATLTLLQMDSGGCIGGFTNASWSSPEKPEYKRDSGAILFNLEGYRFKCQDPSKAIRCCKSYGSEFGNGALSLNQPFNQPNAGVSYGSRPGLPSENNYKIPGGENSDGKNTLTQKESSECGLSEISKFTIREIEVWGVMLKE